MAKHIVALVNNPATHDTRVIKEAETLASAGYRVTLVCRAAPQLPKQQRVNGVDYVRVTASPVRHAFMPLLRLRHVGSVYWPVYARAGGLLVLVSPVIASLFMLSLMVRVSRKVARSLFGVPQGSSTVSGWWRGLLDWVTHSHSHLMLRLAYPLVLAQDFMLPTIRLVCSLKPDFVHAHDLDTLETAIEASLITGARVVYDAHELEVDRNDRRGAVLRYFVKLQEEVGIRRCDGVVTVSPGIAAELSRRYDVPLPTVILNSPRIESLRAVGGTFQRESLRDRLGLSEATPLVVYVGLITQDRCLDSLVDALVQMPGFHLAFVGPRNAEVAAALVEQARQREVADRFHVVDPVPADQVADFVASADVGVIAAVRLCLSYEYSMPNKLFEMSLAGLPLVVGELESMKQFVIDNKLGLSAPSDDPSSLAAALVAVFKDRATLRPTVQRLADLRARFGWDAQGEKLVALYAALAAG